MERNFTIYEIECAVNHKKYIGRTEKPLKVRYKMHINELRRGAHRNKDLQADFDKYGENQFSITALQENVKNAIWGAYRDIDTGAERTWILRERTFDPDYGYNNHEPKLFANRW